MPITINKLDGTTVLTPNNFRNLTINANTGSDVIAAFGGDEQDAELVKFYGPSMDISLEYTLVEEGSTVVSGTGGTVTSARGQVAYLYNTLMSKGAEAYKDHYTLTLEYSTTALDSGTATAGAASTLTDGGKSRTVNAYKNKVLKLTGGTGSGQVRNILSNTSTVLTVDKEWTTNPDNTSNYSIIDGFSRKGNLARITCTMTSDSPLTFMGSLKFQVGKAF